MELVITIDLESQALQHERAAELNRMFTLILGLLAEGKTKGILFDKNGNDQGDWEITESLAEMQPKR